eukprot:2513578-Amphidinium_carterae.1
MKLESNVSQARLMVHSDGAKVYGSAHRPEDEHKIHTIVKHSARGACQTPNFVAHNTYKVGDKCIRTQAVTQILDRAWQYLKEGLRQAKRSNVEDFHMK